MAQSTDAETVGAHRRSIHRMKVSSRLCDFQLRWYSPYSGPFLSQRQRLTRCQWARIREFDEKKLDAILATTSIRVSGHPLC